MKFSIFTKNISKQPKQDANKFNHKQENSLKHHIIIKFGNKQNMLAFQHKGQLYMNTLANFQKIEKTDSLRGDISEGLSHTKPAKGAKIKFLNSNVELTSTDAFRFQHPDSKNINIFSLYGITDTNLTPERDKRLLEFGDSAVIVTNREQFTERIAEECKRKNYRYEFSPVEYVNRNTYEGEMGPFRKYSELEYQSEFRIAIWTYKKCVVDDLFIGDISDITAIVNIEEVVNKMTISITPPQDSPSGAS